jgi:D-alanyl-D-alanine carboxypeptidase (penicillin-binding protein 5/6)
MKHEKIFDYTQIWMDTIRNGSFGLSNTNKLIRFYKGATGMKTGFTDEAKFCLSGTAKRDGMQLIAIVLGADSSNDRFATAKRLFDFGFANYSILTPEIPSLEPIAIKRGIAETAEVYAKPISILIEKGNNKNIEAQISMNEEIFAPFDADTEVGYISYLAEGKEIARAKILTKNSMEEISYFSLLIKLFDRLLFK